MIWWILDLANLKMEESVQIKILIVTFWNLHPLIPTSIYSGIYPVCKVYLGCVNRCLELVELEVYKMVFIFIDGMNLYKTSHILWRTSKASNDIKP